MHEYMHALVHMQSQSVLLEFQGVHEYVVLILHGEVVVILF